MSKAHSMTNVYAMLAGDYVKFGITNSIKNRIKQVQTGTPIFIHEIRYITVPSRGEALIIEEGLHSHCVDKHTYGEWFYATAMGFKKPKEVFSDCKVITNGRKHTDEAIAKILQLYRIKRWTPKKMQLERLSKLRQSTAGTYKEKFIMDGKTAILKVIDEEIRLSLMEVSKKTNKKEICEMGDKEHIDFMKQQFLLKKGKKERLFNIKAKR